MHGFDQGQLGEAGLVEHAIGMNDLAMSVVKLQPPETSGSRQWQAALDPLVLARKTPARRRRSSSTST